jgi:hypothetical protein
VNPKKIWKVDRVEHLLPGEAPPYGFNITNDWGKPLVLFVYATRSQAEAAATQIRSAIEQALDIQPRSDA